MVTPLTVESYMKPPLCLPHTDTVSAAVKHLARQDGTAALVVNDAGELCGIFTRRDLLHRVVLLEHDPRVLTLEDVMTERPATARPGDDVSDALHRMLQTRCDHLPVVNEGVPVGLLSTHAPPLKRLLWAAAALLRDESQRRRIETVLRDQWRVGLI